MTDFSQPLFGLRELRSKLSHREAQGEHLWTEHLSEEVRSKFAYSIIEFGQQHRNFTDHSQRLNRYSDIAEHVARSVCLHLGILALPQQETWKSPEDVILQTIVSARTEHAIVFSLIEAIWQTTEPLTYHPTAPGQRLEPRQQFGTNIRIILADHRISYDFVEGQFVARGNQVMHGSVVEPTLSLLSGRKKFAAAERKFFDALKSLQESRFDDAITDTYSALEETLDAVGCKGNTLSRKFQHATTLGIVTAYDKRIVDWLCADRVEKGDMHSGGSKTRRADAWLAVHIAGAVILCIAEEEGRGSPRSQ